MLGTLIMRLDQPGAAEEALLAAGDLPLLADLSAVAERLDLSTGSFASPAVRRFIERADDQDWLWLHAILNRAEQPGLDALRAILRRAVADARAIGNEGSEDDSTRRS